MEEAWKEGKREDGGGRRSRKLGGLEKSSQEREEGTMEKKTPHRNVPLLGKGSFGIRKG